MSKARIMFMQQHQPAPVLTRARALGGINMSFGAHFLTVVSLTVSKFSSIFNDFNAFNAFTLRRFTYALHASARMWRGWGVVFVKPLKCLKLLDYSVY